MTRLAPALLIGALCVSACTKEAPAPAPANETAPAAAEAPAAVPSLEGNWDAVKFDGKPKAQPFAMTVAFAAGKVTITSECVTMRYAYKQDRNLVSFTPEAGGALCGRGRTADESLANSALKNGSMVIFADEGKSATISGSGGNLTLEKR